MLWAIFNLSRNPGAQRKLLEEIREVVPPDQDPCGEHIKSMPYLKACLKESMRYSIKGSQWKKAFAGNKENALTSKKLHMQLEIVADTHDIISNLINLSSQKVQIRLTDCIMISPVTTEINRQRWHMTGSKTSFMRYGAVISNNHWSQLKSNHFLPLLQSAVSLSSRAVTSCRTCYLRLIPLPHHPGNVYDLWLEIISHPFLHRVCLHQCFRASVLFYTIASLRPYSCAFSNSYRLSPSVPFTSRTLDKDVVLGDYAIPKGVSGLVTWHKTNFLVFICISLMTKIIKKPDFWIINLFFYTYRQFWW